MDFLLPSLPFPFQTQKATLSHQQYDSDYGTLYFIYSKVEGTQITLLSRRKRVGMGVMTSFLIMKKKKKK
jgi:hypothetical protein